MKKKKKSKHQNEDSSKPGSSSDGGAKQNIFKNYIKEMEEKTKEFSIKNPNLDAKFYLFQTIQNKEALRDMIFNLVYFYDINFVGNKDFIHIPNIGNILDNILKYPIMVATQKDRNGTEEILGTSTIKFENNKSISENPYFPTVNENVLTITGILTKHNAIDKDGNKIHGIGKELFKSAIRSAYNINKETKIRLIGEVDCRNVQSYNAISKAVKELNDENINVSLNISGYYEILDNEGDLVEAPTFILEVGLDDENKHVLDNPIEFNYLNCKSTELFSELNNVIEENTNELKEYVNRKSDKTIIYHELEPINALNVKFNIGATAEGNERIPGVNVLQYESTHNKSM